MPLEIEVYDVTGSSWKRVGSVQPGDRPGSISDCRAGGREVYLFMCALDNSSSCIYRSRGGIDFSSTEIREIRNVAGFELIQVLKPGEFYTLSVKTDVSSEKRELRLWHR